MKNRKIVNAIEGEVLDVRMVMTVRLPEGTTVKVNGNMPKGSVIDLWATDVSRSGQLMGYEGYTLIERARRTVKAPLNVQQPKWFSQSLDGIMPLKQEEHSHAG